MTKELKVKIEKEKAYESAEKFTLLTSHNHHQWSGGSSMTKDELVKVRDELNRFLDDTNPLIPQLKALLSEMEEADKDFIESGDDSAATVTGIYAYKLNQIIESVNDE